VPLRRVLRPSTSVVNPEGFLLTRLISYAPYLFLSSMTDFTVVESIRRFGGKIKALRQYEREFFMFALFLFFGTLAFGLGRLSKIEREKTPVKIEIPNSPDSLKGAVG